MAMLVPALPSSAAAGRRSGGQLLPLGLAALAAASLALYCIHCLDGRPGGGAFLAPGTWRVGARPPSAPGSQGCSGGRRVLNAVLLTGGMVLTCGAAACVGLLGAAPRMRARRAVQCISAATPRAARAMRAMAVEVATPCTRLLRGFLSPCRTISSHRGGVLGRPELSLEPVSPDAVDKERLEKIRSSRTCVKFKTMDLSQVVPRSGSPSLSPRGENPGERPIHRSSSLPSRALRPRPVPLTCVEDEHNRSRRSSNASSNAPACAPTTPAVSPLGSPVVVPSLRDLDELFELANTRGTLGIQDLEAAVPVLNQRLHLSLEENDVPRLYSFLKRTSSGPVTRNEFATGITELAHVLHRLSNRLSMREMKTILVAAFDRFDEDGDGVISLAEFIASSQMLGLQMDPEDAECLFRFFAGGRGGMVQDELVEEKTIWETSAALLERSAAQLRDKYGWTSMVNLVGRVQAAFGEPGNPQEKVSRALKAAWEGAEDVCDVAELAADAAGLALAASYINDELQEQLTTGAMQDLDLMNVAPFAVCLGLFATNFAKELDELVPKEMNPNEAMLYAQHFQKHGFSQAEFRRVLSCPGCHWGAAKPGEVLNRKGDASVKLIVKGRMEVSSPSSPSRSGGRIACLGPGSSIGGVGYLRGREIWQREVVHAQEEVLYVSWDPEGLRNCFEHHQELSLKMDALLASTFSKNLRAILSYRSSGSKLSLLEQDVPPTPSTPGMDCSDFGEVLDAMGISDKEAVTRDDVRAFLSQVDQENTLGVTEDLCSQLFDWLDADGNGAVSPTEFRSQMNELGRCLQSLDGISMPQLLGHFMKGAMSEEDLKELMPYADKNIGLGTEESDCKRLFAHVDKNKDGVVSLKELAGELLELEDCMKASGGLTIKELTTLLHRAFQQFDTDHDGQVSAEEFLQAVQRLQIAMTEEQALMIHSYLDTDKSGAIDLGEWNAGGHLLNWLDALKVALASQVQRKGLNKLGYIAEVARGIAEGPGDLVAKAKLMLDRVWDGTDELADAANVFTDSVGVCAALSGIWQEVSGINSLAEIDNMDLLPFLIFLGISSVKMVRHLAEGQVSDLSEREALLYATVFQKEGFSVMDFSRLMSYGDARWEEVSAGEMVGGAPDMGEAERLHLVARGGCMLADAKGKRLASIGSGGYIGVLPGQDGERCLSDQKAWATEQTTVLTWDSKKLRYQLQRDENLRLKVARAVTISMADRLLSAKEREETPHMRRA